MNIREQQKEKRRDEILLAGLNLFVEKGYAATKTSDIARAVNMSDGLLFHYFSTKEMLYEALIRIAMEASQDWLEAGSPHPLDFFMGMTEQILQMLRESPGKAKFFVLLAQALRSTTTPPSVLRLLAAQEERYAKTVAQIRAGQQSGELRGGNPEALAYAFWCSVQGIAEQLATHPETPFPQAEWIVAILKNEG